MNTKDYNVETRVINGNRYYRCCVWDSHTERSASIYANSLEALNRKIRRCGLRTSR